MPERRTGFDRRRAGGLLHTISAEPVLLLSVLVLLNALSLVDWVLTLRALDSGAVEANLAIGVLIGVSPLAALIFKTLVMLCVSAFIWYGRRYRLVVGTAIGGVLIYGMLLVYHFAAYAASVT